VMLVLGLGLDCKSYEYANIRSCNDFSMLIRHDTLWPWPLPIWPWKFVVGMVSCDHVIIVCGKFDRNRTTPGWVIHNLANFWPCYVTLWPRPLTSWPWTFVVLRASCVQTLFKIWVKSNNMRQSYWRYCTFWPTNFRGWGTFSRRFSGIKKL